MNLFRCADYRQFLDFQIRQNRSVYGYKSRLAKAAGCRNSFFSQVLKGDFELSAEHALGLAGFWKLTASETDYFIELVHLSRARTPAMKRYLQARLRHMATVAEKELLRGRAQEVADDWKARFYSSWHYTAAHELTTFPGGRTADQIALRLELPLQLVQETLSELEQIGLVELRGKSWIAKVLELIVPVGTVHSAQHIDHWTARAALNARRQKTPLPSFHKCWVFGISPSDYAALREMLLEHITRCQRLIPNSEREELVCMGLHLFPV